MRRRAVVLLAGAAVGALGCAAELVERRPRRDGPVKEVGALDAGGGHVRYSLRGPGFVVSGRRRDAWAKMAEACGGAERFKVVDEVARQEDEASFTADLEDSLSKADAHYRKVTMQHVYFECLN